MIYDSMCPQCSPMTLPYGNSCTWANDDVWLYIAGTNEPSSTQQVK